MLQTILLVLLIIDCVALVAVILLQRSEGGALGMGGAGGGGLMTARGAGNLLTRTTAFLGAGFFVLCCTLTILGNMERASSISNRLGSTLRIAPQSVPLGGAPAPAPAQKQTAPATNSLGDLETGGPITLKPAAGGSALPGLPSAPAAKGPARKSAPQTPASKP